MFVSFIERWDMSPQRAIESRIKAKKRKAVTYLLAICFLGKRQLVIVCPMIRLDHMLDEFV